MAITVEELIGELEGMPKEAEIDYIVNKDSIDLLIGEDESIGDMITIPSAGWR